MPAALSNAGVGLTEAAIQWGRRPPTPPRVAVTPRDLAIFAWLEQHRFATTTMLATLFWDQRPSTAPNMRLKLLHDVGYLDKLRPARATGGSSEWIYRLTRRGWDALSDTGLSVTGRLPFGELTDLAYAAHDLQLDGAIISAARAALPGPGPLIDRLPFQWQGPDLGRVQRGGGQPAAPGPAALLPDGHITATAASIPGVLEPDATLIGAHATSGRPFAVMIEYDRTRRPAKQRDRWRRYDRFLTVTWRESRFAAHHNAPLVIYLLPHTKLIPTFLNEADKHLTAWVGPAAGTPAHGNYPGRDRLLFTSRERLLAADWAMECVPAQPPDVRATTTVHARTVTVPIFALFGDAARVAA